MEQHHGGIHRAFKYKLKPTPNQERLFERTLMLCRHVYNAAIGERREAWRMRGVSVTYYQQKAELPSIKVAMPEYAEVHSQVLQDVVLRVEHAYQGFFQRIKDGGTPGYPRFQGHARYHSLTYPQVGEHGGARFENGALILSKIGNVAVRWSRPLEGTPRAVCESMQQGTGIAGSGACGPIRPTCGSALSEPWPPVGPSEKRLGWLGWRRVRSSATCNSRSGPAV
jgi:helix-turn-helix protein